MTNPADTYSAHASAWAQKARTGSKISYEYLEKPAMYAALPDLTGKRVLCVGCGSGEECRVLKDRGAASVLGIDIAPGLIEVARASYPDIQFEVRAMQDIAYPADSFDFIYSSLALHYAESWTDILRRIRTCLVPGSEFLFSTHHPVKWGMEKSREGDHFTYRLSYELWGNDKAETHGDYLTPRRMDEVLLNQIPVTFWHRPFGDLFRDIRDSGFTLLDIIEPLPTDGAKTKKKNFWLAHQKIPQFVIFKLRGVGRASPTAPPPALSLPAPCLPHLGCVTHMRPAGTQHLLAHGSVRHRSIARLWYSNELR